MASKRRNSLSELSAPPPQHQLSLRRHASEPLVSSLKKQSRSSFAQKWSAYVGHHNASKCCRHVQFRDIGQEFERPATTADEKAMYHYSPTELNQMLSLGKRLAQCASRFDGLAADTIVEQGFLTLPAQRHSMFAHAKRYYCLLQRNELRCYPSPLHAAKRTGLKVTLTIIQVQDVSKLAMARQLALFGAHLPQDLAHMLLATTASGACVPLTAETKLAKRNWLHTLRKLTHVVEPTEQLDDDDDASPTASDASSLSPTSDARCCTSAPVSDVCSTKNTSAVALDSDNAIVCAA